MIAKPPNRHRRSSGPRLDRTQTVAALDALCARLRPGDQLPTHVELMRALRASERAVLGAIDELRRSGRVVRRNGVGTFVAVPGDAADAPSLMPVDGGGTIVALARPDQSFFDLCLQELHRQSVAAGATLMCRPVDSEMSELLTLPSGSDRPRGFVVFHRSLEPLAHRLQEAGCRVVMVGAAQADEAPRVPRIHGDHELGGHLAVRHLLDLGHRRLGFLGDDDALHTPRWRGMQRALAEAGRQRLSATLTVIHDRELAEWHAAPGRAAAAVRRAGAPTAILAWNDHRALQLLGAFGRAGVRVPDEVAVVGYDNLPEGAVVHPALTTVDQALHQQIAAALALLMRAEPPSPNHATVTVPTLIARASTAPYRPGGGR